MGKTLSNRCEKKLLHPSKKLEPHTFKIAWKRSIQKTAEAIVHLAGNKITEKIITTASKGTRKD